MRVPGGVALNSIPVSNGLISVGMLAGVWGLSVGAADGGGADGGGAGAAEDGGTEGGAFGTDGLDGVKGRCGSGMGIR